MVSVLNSSPDRAVWVRVLGKTLYSHSVSLDLNVETCTNNSTMGEGGGGG